MNLGTIVDSVLLLGGDYEYLLPVAPTLNPEFLYCEIREDDWGDARLEVPDIKLVPDALPALYHSRAAIVASGTATVEAAIMSTPFVMVYRVTPLTYALGKPRIKVPYFAMVNLIAGEKIVPELVQDDFTAGNVVAELRKVLPEGPARAAMLGGFERVKSRLLSPNPALNRSAAERAAAIILQMLGLGTARTEAEKQRAPA
jgi:lipid-A-disaccharide synthase